MMDDETGKLLAVQACNVNLYRQFGPKTTVDRWLADKRAEKAREELLQNGAKAISFKAIKDWQRAKPMSFLEAVLHPDEV